MLKAEINYISQTVPLNLFPALFVVALAMANVASQVKAADIRVLFVKPLVYWTRFFIIATAFSRPQIDAIGYSSNFDDGLHIFGWERLIISQCLVSILKLTILSHTEMQVKDKRSR